MGFIFVKTTGVRVGPVSRFIVDEKHKHINQGIYIIKINTGKINC